MNAFDLLGLGHMPFYGRRSKTLWPEVHHPKQLDAVCGQARAARFLLHEWDGKKTLVVVGPHGAGKTTLVGLVVKQRGGRLVDASELSAFARAGEYVRMHPGAGSCYVHFSGGTHTAREILTVVAQKVRVVVECTPGEAASDLRDVVRKSAVCNLDALEDADVRAWLHARAVPFAHVVPGDLRATLLDAQSGARDMRARRASGDAHAAMDYVGANVAHMEHVAEAMSDRALVVDTDVAAEIARCIERVGLGRRAAVNREWSMLGVAATKRHALIGHTSSALPRAPEGSRRLMEVVWHAGASCLDKRGREIAAQHAMGGQKKARRQSAIRKIGDAGETAISEN